MNLNQITLPAYDLAETVQFYQKLGCVLIVDTPHYARFESPAGDTTLSLSAQPAPNSASGDPTHHPVTIYFEVDDVDKEVAQLEEMGLKFDLQPSDMPYLWREAILRDPSGNAIKIYHAGKNRRYPPWRIPT